MHATGEVKILTTLKIGKETYQSNSPNHKNDKIIILFLWVNSKCTPHEGLWIGHQAVMAPRTNKTLSHYTHIDYS